ncbi:hypothetical protein MTR67_037448 [Solanum verrucosum]|uniref:Reverse transcriptase zinc-binding domain-containing protein n=1 Tax=Solanum verrucosum TaxID=315347 RepID=A0AAF0UDH6_SOLVR|nr:hypothetical protein MTR67_037448 [Solanum verrucosum]
MATNSLWGTYMWNKYCKKDHPVVAKGSGASHVWKMLIQIREEVEHEIWWKIRAGKCSFWYDNRTQQGALYFIEDGGIERSNLEVRDFIDNNGWHKEKLQSIISEDMTDYIIESIKSKIGYEADCPRWMTNTNGEFTVQSTFRMMRKRREQKEWLSNVWIKGLPLKISFFLWRVWRKRISTDDNLKRMRIHIASRCHCYEEYEHESMEHAFLTSPISQKLWKKFASCAGIELNGVHLQQLINSWWKVKSTTKIQKIFKIVPATPMWELWKQRNAKRHKREKQVGLSATQMGLQEETHESTLMPFVKRKGGIPKTWKSKHLSKLLLETNWNFEPVHIPTKEGEIRHSKEEEDKQVQYLLKLWRMSSGTQPWSNTDGLKGGGGETKNS